jgi:SAM-dependent methyltransferase
VHDATTRVREFYDRIGWVRQADGCFGDAEAFEDRRPVAAAYIARCHARVLRHLGEPGGLLLDCASGPVQYEAYRAYSRGYRRRVCVDISLVALREARATLGSHGWYVVGDITALPFRPAAFAAAVSLHTICHVPPTLQPAAFAELYRVIQRRAVIVHAVGPHGPLHRLLTLPRRLLGRASGPAPAPLPFFPQPIRWLRREVLARYPARLACWRTLSAPMMQAVVRPWLGGLALLRVLFVLETWLPRVFGRIGQYPLIVLTKP